MLKSCALSKTGIYKTLCGGGDFFQSLLNVKSALLCSDSTAIMRMCSFSSKFHVHINLEVFEKFFLSGCDRGHASVWVGGVLLDSCKVRQVRILSVKVVSGLAGMIRTYIIFRVVEDGINLGTSYFLHKFLHLTTTTLKWNKSWCREI